jgi:prepilin-type N-terminal cleavage/methylation domain-containing protein
VSAAVIRPAARARGFTLVELAIVLGIVTLLLSGLFVAVSAQIELQRISETRATIDSTREALLGFAAANGRLPCPASDTSNGREAFCETASGSCSHTTNLQSHGRCNRFFNGFLPAAALGITPTDNDGYALDGWGNRLRYAVSDTQLVAGTYTFTGQDGMKGATMAAVETAAESGTGLLFVCSSANGITSGSCGSAAGTVTITRKTPALVYSTGKNSATGGTGADEAANPNPNATDLNRVYVYHEPTAAGSGGEFDDIMTWLSLPVLFNRLITAGRLP